MATNDENVVIVSGSRSYREQDGSITPSGRGSRTENPTDEETENTDKQGSRVETSTQERATDADTRVDYGDYDSHDSSVGDSYDLSSLKDDITKMYETLFGNTSGADTTKLGKALGDVLAGLQKAFKNQFDLSSNESLNLAQNVYNTLSGYITSRLDLLYNRENWVFQQAYNHPISQMRRLMEAGINPAFYYGCLGSSNAEQIQGSQTTPSQLNAQLDPMNYRLRNAMQGVEMGLGFAQTGMNLATGIQNIGGFTNAMAQASKTRTEAGLVVPEFVRQGQWGDMNAYAGLVNAGANQQNADTNTFNANVDASYKDCLVQNMDEQIDLGYAQLANAWDIAELGSETNLQTAQIGANAQVQSASIGANAQVQSARITSSAQERIARANRRFEGQLAKFNTKSAIKLKVADKFFDIIPTLYRETEQSQSYLRNKTTGEKHALTMNAKGEYSLPGTNFKFGSDIGSVDEWTKSNSEWERTTETIKTSALDFDRLANLEMIATKVANGLMTGELNASDGHRFNQRLNWGRDTLWKRINKTIGDAFARYTMRYNGIDTSQIK